MAVWNVGSITSSCSGREPEIFREDRRSGLREWRISSLSGGVLFLSGTQRRFSLKSSLKILGILELIKAFLSISRKPYVLLPFWKSYFTKRHFLSISKHRGIEFQSHITKVSGDNSPILENRLGLKTVWADHLREWFVGCSKCFWALSFLCRSSRPRVTSLGLRTNLFRWSRVRHAGKSVRWAWAYFLQGPTARGLDCWQEQGQSVYIRFSSWSESDICYWGESLKNYFLLPLLYLSFFTFQEA